MAKVNYAAIDIGSNAVRLLIKSIDTTNPSAAGAKKQLLLRVPLRLGFDVFSMGELSEKKADKLSKLMKVFSQLMRIYDVVEYRACATSAMRDAANGRDIIKKIEKQTGIKIEIINGQQEAQIIYNNHNKYTCDTVGNFMYVDVGGGSTEVNLLVDGKRVFSMSYNIGTVRILSDAVKPDSWHTMTGELKELCSSLKEVNIIGSGGNINKLCRLASDTPQMLSTPSLEKLYNELKPLTVEERMRLYDMKADRADVIVPAAEIFLTIARAIGAKNIHVPVIGLSDGIIDNLIKSHCGVE